MADPPAGPVPPAGGGVAARAAAAAQVYVDDPAAPEVSPDDRHHLVRVLRLRPGEVVVASDGRGRWCRCRFRGGDGDGGGRLLEPEEPPREEPPAGPPLTVAFAPAKGDRPEWVVQKLTELGIDRIVPLLADRSVVRWEGDRAGRAIDRLRRVAREAGAQSRRVWLPEVTGLATLADLADLAWPADRAGSATPGEPWGGEAPAGSEDPASLAGEGGRAGTGLAVALAELGGGPLTAARTVVAVGPEGGWSPRERSLGLATVGLGPTVLRAETAAVAAAAVMATLRTGTVVGGDRPTVAGRRRPGGAGVGESS